LLRTFEATRSEGTFEELVRRHGPMVLATCRRILGNPDDAEDAFQAVFLVLARKASTVRGNLAGWLYAVAVRTARGVRIMRERRRKHETRASARSESVVLPESDHDHAAVIDEELARLPEHYRLAVVLCELRGLSRKQAASELGIPEGTLSGRLAVARRKLAALLSARGLAPAAVVALLAPASVSAGLVESAVLAVRGTAGPVASAAASAVVKAMLFDQLKAVALAAGMLLTVVCGGFAMTGSGRGEQPAPAAPAPRLVDDPAAKLVEQLGAPEFADREAAQKKLRELGVKANPALRAGLKSENPEVRNRAAKVLAEIRKDALAALVKGFDPAKEQQPDHPIWKRFKTIAGDTRAARDLFAVIIKNANWLRRLDAAEANPDVALREYQEAVIEVGKQFQFNMSVLFHIPVWPCDRGEGVAFLLLLGSHPNTASIPPGNDPARGKFDAGEGRIHFARGLELGLQGKILDSGPGFQPEPVKAAEGTDRVFAKLLAAWLEHREPAADVVPNCLWLAARHGAKEVLPFARIIAADKFLHDREPARRLYAAALALMARVGTREDLPLFEQYFQDESVIATFELEDGKTGSKGATQLRDAAFGLALVLHGEDPAQYGFVIAGQRWTQTYARAVVGKWDPCAFGYLNGDDNKPRLAAHTKAKTFLDKRPKIEPKPAGQR
jgi:RNA polymerase sigma factor (sigma-70 family)